MEFTERFLRETAEIARGLDRDAVERVVALVAETREREGRIFVLGCGGGAGHASHAANDFRMLGGIPAFTPTDNASELTARINDDGWERAYADWLSQFRPDARDLVFVFSVGGGSEEHGLSVNIVRALERAKELGARITGVVGRDGGATARLADACVIVPTVNEEMTTAHTESFQAVVWHLVVSHPAVNRRPTRWESEPKRG